ncbi:MAG: CHAD domain-containing protein [Anaerolineales bacterium]|nr:CHAD domain-containing protein [Anaerolineales bacterium]MCX7609911.1 CHAD domain-containing protein [Anaerolineales bacterium]
MSLLEAKLILKALDQRGRNYFAQLKASQEEPTSESIHELRVSARRFFAVLELLRAIQPSSDIKSLQRELRNQLNDLDEISDIQMMAAEIGKVVERFPTASAFLRYLQKQEKNLRRKASKHLHSLDQRKLEKQMHLVEKIQESNAIAPPGLHLLVLRTLDDAFRVVLERYRAIDPVKTETIHRLRIAFRKFRYLIEIVHPALREYPPEILAGMRDYQRKMGVIQDLETLLRAIRKYAKKHERFEGEDLLQYYQTQHQEAVLAFTSQMDDLYGFWRLTRSGPFPWTKKRRSDLASADDQSEEAAEMTCKEPPQILSKEQDL